MAHLISSSKANGLSSDSSDGKLGAFVCQAFFGSSVQSGGVVFPSPCAKTISVAQWRWIIWTLQERSFCNSTEGAQHLAAPYISQCSIHKTKCIIIKTESSCESTSRRHKKNNEVMFRTWSFLLGNSIINRGMHHGSSMQLPASHDEWGAHGKMH